MASSFPSLLLATMAVSRYLLIFILSAALFLRNYTKVLFFMGGIKNKYFCVVVNHKRSCYNETGKGKMPREGKEEKTCIYRKNDLSPICC